MHQTVGLLAAFIALLAWGFGDFAIQKSVRIVGAIPTLFFIGLIGVVGLLPFAWSDIPQLYKSAHTGSLLIWTIIITLACAIILFEALKRGKLSVIEPVASFELPITIIISTVIIGEIISRLQLWLIILVFIGLLTTVLHREPRHWWNIFRHSTNFERGVVIAIFGTAIAALTNVFTGLLSQHTTPMTAIWGVDVGLTILCLFWMILRGQIRTTFGIARQHWGPILLQGILDNIAWLAYAYAVTAIPIAITIAITESYIALAALLGITLNKERLQRHQYIGIAVTLVAVIILATISTSI